MPEPAPDLPSLERILHAYHAWLHAAAAVSLSQRFVIATEPGRAAAAQIAGAATLLSLPDIARAQQAVRHGFCDFLVYSLDEAVRILKVEVRRGAAVGVCLAAPRGLLEECVARGLQPDLLDCPQPELQARGAQLPATPRPGRNATVVGMQVNRSAWRQMQAADAVAIAWSEAPAAQRWGRVAPERLGRAWAHLRAWQCSSEAAPHLLAALAALPWKPGDACELWLDGQRYVPAAAGG